MPTGRHQVQVEAAHGPGAVARNAPPIRYAGVSGPAAGDLHAVKVRDLEAYEQPLEVA
jgi:hypothetical protein